MSIKVFLPKHRRRGQTAVKVWERKRQERYITYLVANPLHFPLSHVTVVLEFSVNLTLVS